MLANGAGETFEVKLNSYILLGPFNAKSGYLFTPDILDHLARLDVLEAVAAEVLRALVRGRRADLAAVILATQQLPIPHKTGILTCLKTNVYRNYMYMLHYTYPPYLIFLIINFVILVE